MYEDTMLVMPCPGCASWADYDKGAWGMKMTPQQFVRSVLDDDEFVCRCYGSGMPKSEAKEMLRRFLAELCGPNTTWEEFKTNFKMRTARTYAMLALAKKKGAQRTDKLKDVLSHEDWQEIFLLSKQMLTWNSETNH
jgi:hypothetical protein